MAMLRQALSGSVLLCVVIAGLLQAQDIPRPGPQHEKLAELVGSWDAVMEMNGQKTKAVATYKSICSGMWIASDFEGELGEGLKFQGHGLDGYDVNKKKYVGVWVDSMSSAPMQFEGDVDAKSKLLVMTGEMPGPDGKPQKVKTTTEFRDKDHFTFRMYMVLPDGEQPAFSIDYSRRK
jgi:hypothetical protein